MPGRSRSPSSRSTSPRLVRAVVAARLPEATLDVPATAIVIETDPRRLERILANLLDNAREHAPGAPVEVSLALDRCELVIAVFDRGPGVPPDQLERYLRALLQGRPVPPRREQRPGPGDRGRARGAARRLPDRGQPRRRGPADRAPAACDLIVTARRRDGDRPGGCWAPDRSQPGARPMKPMPRLLASGLVASSRSSRPAAGPPAASGPSRASPRPVRGATGPDLTPGPSDGVTPSRAVDRAVRRADRNARRQRPPAPTATPGARRDHDRSELLRARCRAGQHRPRAGPARGAQDDRRRDDGHEILLAGPTPIEGESSGPATAIPEGTRLLGLAVKSGSRP